MGRTLFGIDLDDSRTGRFVRGLLDEEELEMLADGGRAPDDGGSDAADSGSGSDADAAPDGGDADASSEADGGTASVTDGSEDGSDHEAAPNGGVGGSAGVSVEGPDSSADDEESESLDEAFEEQDESLLARLKPLLLKGAAVAAVLAVVGFVLYRYGDKIVGAVRSRFGGDGDEEDSEGPGYVGETPREEAPPRSTVAPATERVETPSDERPSDAERADRAAAQAGDGSDAGALVGLAALAVIAALARKFGERPESDPLVEGDSERR